MSILSRFVAKRIRDLRKKSGLTQVELAERAGISEMTLSGAEVERHPTSIEVIHAICQALGISMGEFFSSMSPEPQKAPNQSINEVYKLLGVKIKELSKKKR